MPKLIVGAALLDDLVKPRELLVARRNAPASLAGLWEFPGGKVEAGESAEQALHRELSEELGVGIQLGEELLNPAAEAWPLAGSAVMRVWFATLTQGVPTALQDHDELRWMALDEGEQILRLPWIPADFPIVAELLKAVQPQLAE
ncbi:(deoxy)nucleoside triphosphate pyrophosphohydrolase [Psychromicrobium sp. YIM B11713]|uniref:(deoxy)nucleoside triphosphate pyrophosphohydrolase n=1 Tax=Psychromicrobium sp. YIM B11713 TaxID=3145233 RepID=UPI00374FD7D6